jgi:S1-C subfamily serine protease
MAHRPALTSGTEDGMPFKSGCLCALWGGFWCTVYVVGIPAVVLALLLHSGWVSLPNSSPIAQAIGVAVVKNEDSDSCPGVHVTPSASPIALAQAPEASATPAVHELTVPEIVAKASSAVIEIVSLDAKGNPTGLGTGFFTDERATIALTNFHVIRGAASVRARTLSGVDCEFVGVLYASKKPDLALLKFKPGPGRSHLAITRNLDPVIGSRVIVLGSPEGLGLAVSDGLVSGTRDHGNVIQISAAISPGSSGSPVLSMDGHYVGVVVGYLAEGQNLNFAVPAASVRSMVTRAVNSGAITRQSLEP